MKNLAGCADADEVIREELYLAGITVVSVDKTRSEVPCTVIGRLGKWTFTRAWYYWIAEVEVLTDGLPLGKAMELHNRKHPVKDCNLGRVIRSGGHCGCPSPDEYGAEAVHGVDLDAQLEALGYRKEYVEFLKESHFHISVGDMSRLFNEGKLKGERYVDCYHIDDQIGLVEFAKMLGYCSCQFGERK